MSNSNYAKTAKARQNMRDIMTKRYQNPEERRIQSVRMKRVLAIPEVKQRMLNSCVARMVPLEDRFWKNINKEGSNGCWKWLAYKTKAGYGQIYGGGKLKLAHRVSWEIHNGEIPEKKIVCHHCDNPECCNPDHLFLGTHKDNSVDMVNKSRDNWRYDRTPETRRKLSLKAKCNKGDKCGAAVLTEEQVITIKNHLAQGNLTHRRISELFGVARCTITAIAAGRNWKHL